MPEIMVKTPMPTPRAIEIWYGRRRGRLFTTAASCCVVVIASNASAPWDREPSVGYLDAWRATASAAAGLAVDVTLGAAQFTKKGDTVIFTSYSGTEIKIEGKEYKLLSSDDILAIVG